MQIKFYLSALGIRTELLSLIHHITGSETIIKIKEPNFKIPFYLRVPSSDILTYRQIFIAKEYDFDVTEQPNVIVDAGANIGLASIFFANKYPKTKIIAIEPESSNFLMLKKNIEAYSNIVPVQAALWSANEEINLVDQNLDKWGFLTESSATSKVSLGTILHQVEGMTVDKIMKDYGLDKIDILKIDIEGAEKEVFNNTSAWLGKVDALIVELHERIKRGCNRSFYNGSNGFDDEWMKGENIYLTRNNSKLKRAKKP